MKLLMFGTLPINLAEISGGVETVSVNLLQGLKNRKDISVTFVSFSEEIQQQYKVDYSDNVQIQYLPLKYPRLILIDYLMNRRVLLDVLKGLKPDIIHIQAVSPALIRFWGVPKSNLIVTQHGVYKEEIKFTKGLKEKAKFYFKLWIEKYYYPKFKNKIFISEYGERSTKTSHGDKNCIINNPINPSFYNYSVSFNHTNNLIYVGWISIRKNPLMILKAMLELREEGIVFNLDLVGKFKEKHYQTELESYISDHKMDDQVTFRGGLTQNEVVNELTKDSIFVLPSKVENAPLSISEAMAMGKVIIATDVGGVSEMFENETSGFLLDKENPQSALVSVLKRIHNKEIDLSEIATNAHNLAKKCYDPDVVISKTLDFYQTTMNHKNEAVEK